MNGGHEMFTIPALTPPAATATPATSATQTSAVAVVAASKASLRNLATPATPVTQASAVAAVAHVAVAGPDRFDSQNSAPTIPCQQVAGVTCAACRYFAAGTGERPDGHCRRYKEPTWGAVPFQCPGFEAADSAARALDDRRRCVEERLRKRSEDRVAFDVADAPLKPCPGEPVSVVLAVRTAAGIVSGELRVPRERFDASLFLRTLTDTASLPS
jgi:hypothetical protein